MGAFLRKYGTGTGADVYVPMIKRAVVDQAVGADWTPASGDVKVSLDGGAAANIGTLPAAVAMGGGALWKFVFSNAELQCKVLTVVVSDSATKVVEDQFFTVETYGHASAMYQADLSAANLPADLKTILTDAQSATDLKDFADAGYDPATNKVEGVKLADTATNLTNLPSIPAGWLTAAGIADGAFTAAKFASGAFDAVWTVAVRILTAGTNIVLAKGVGVTGFNDLSSGDVGSAAEAALANYNAATESDVDGAAAAVISAVPTAVENAEATRDVSNDNPQANSLGAAVNTRASQTSVDAADDKLDTLLTRITSNLFSGITSVGNWLGAIAGKTADTATRAEINATTAGANYNETTASLEALEARMLSTGATARLERSVNAIATGTVGSGSSTTSIVTSALSPAGAVADQFKGRIVTFDAATTTAALRGQATDITASSNAALAVLTVTALAATPASGDTFTIT